MYTQKEYLHRTPFVDARKHRLNAFKNGQDIRILESKGKIKVTITLIDNE